MNESDTRRELIDPKIKKAGWGEVEGSYIRAEFQITNGEIKPGGIRAGIIKADYVLIYKNRKLAVIEAKKDELPVSDGVGQAKDYALAWAKGIGGTRAGVIETDFRIDECLSSSWR